MGRTTKVAKSVVRGTAKAAYKGGKWEWDRAAQSRAESRETDRIREAVRKEMYSNDKPSDSNMSAGEVFQGLLGFIFIVFILMWIF